MHLKTQHLTKVINGAEQKFRVKKTQFYLDPDSEEQMLDFIRENPIIWNVKITDYRRADKRNALWQNQAEKMGRV